MVAAAFIGPGTLTTAATTGASSGSRPCLDHSVCPDRHGDVTGAGRALGTRHTSRDLAALAREFGGRSGAVGWLLQLIVAAIGVGQRCLPVRQSVWRCRGPDRFHA
jgi:hypothetical protein